MKTELPWLIASNGCLPDSWTSLQSFTAARIALGRSGISIPLSETLGFKLAHAHARDAVYSSLDISSLTRDLSPLSLPITSVKSKAKTREIYLQRPDYGRKLDDASVQHLKAETGNERYDVALVLADGLSATAINKHAAAVLGWTIMALKAEGLALAPITLVENGRVAIADEVGSLLNAKVSVILIGERPGLSSPDSMGAYITYQPRPGLTDDARNCVSNIRPEGMSYTAASDKIVYLIRESLRLQLSGIGLKDLSHLLGT